MYLERLWLVDFRNYHQAELAPAPSGLTAVIGLNGEGKTNLLEAITYAATLRSFRGAPSESMIRRGASVAVVRAKGHRDRHRFLVEAEIHPSGRDRVQLNNQPLRRSRDLAGALAVTLFTPDDLELVKGGPQGRRAFLDDLLVSLHRRHEATQSELERVLRQRGMLLKQLAGHPKPDPVSLSTLDVWDAKLVAAGEALTSAREALTTALEPLVNQAYRNLAGTAEEAVVGMAYKRSWEGPLAEALLRARTDDLRRGVTTVGPQRDELELTLNGRAARVESSQGEQRCLALGLRLAGHHLVAGRIGSAPVLLLDDVFSELDPHRSAALVEHLPDCQVVLTTTSGLPEGVRPELVARVEGAKVLT